MAQDAQQKQRVRSAPFSSEYLCSLQCRVNLVFSTASHPPHNAPGCGASWPGALTGRQKVTGEGCWCRCRCAATPATPLSCRCRPASAPGLSSAKKRTVGSSLLPGLSARPAARRAAPKLTSVTSLVCCPRWFRLRRGTEPAAGTPPPRLMEPAGLLLPTSQLLPTEEGLMGRWGGIEAVTASPALLAGGITAVATRGPAGVAASGLAGL